MSTETDRQGSDAGSAPQACIPCRGSGSVISMLGGSEITVQCPWCEGRRQRIDGIDAQARWLAAEARQDGASG